MLSKVVVTTIYYILHDDDSLVRKPADVLEDLSGETTFKVRRVRSKDPMPKDWGYDAIAYRVDDEGSLHQTTVDLTDAWPQDGEDEDGGDEEEEEEEVPPQKPAPPTFSETTPFTDYPPSMFVVLSDGLVCLRERPPENKKPRSTKEPRVAPARQVSLQDDPVVAEGPPDAAIAQECLNNRHARGLPAIQPSAWIYNHVRLLMRDDLDISLSDAVEKASRDWQARCIAESKGKKK